MKISGSMDDESSQHATTYNKLWRREMKALLAVFAVALVPLWFLVRGRQLVPDPTPTPSPTPIVGVDPKSPWRINDNTSRIANIALSPSGNFLAAIVPPAVSKSATSLPNAASAAGTDLVIWRILDGAEVARTQLDGGDNGTIQWARNETSLAFSGQFSQIFAWRAGSLVAALPAGIDYYVEGTWLDLDADLKLEAHSQKGWQAFQISTGNAIALAPQIGRKIYNTPISQSALNVSATYALQPAKRGGPIRLAVFEEEPRPALTPQPTPTPLPTPTPSAAQSAFLREEAKLNEEVSQLMNTLQGEEPLSDEEIARMETRVKAINAQLKTERNRLFGALTPATRATPQPPRWARLTLWDLKGGKQIWQKRLRSGFSKAVLSWSPDGKILTVFGTPRPSRRPENLNQEERGLDFFQGATGKILGSNALDNAFGSLSTKDMAWLPGAWIVVKDRDEQSHPFLRFFNAANGQTVQSWSLAVVHQALGNSFDIMTTDATGSRWAFATGRNGWRVFTQFELDSAARPIPNTATKSTTTTKTPRR